MTVSRANQEMAAIGSRLLERFPKDNGGRSLEAQPLMDLFVVDYRTRLFVLLGAVAARHVVGLSDGIMKMRGRWLEYRVGTRMVPLMPTLHPAYLLRQPAHKKLAWRDLQAIAARMETIGLPRVAMRAN